MLTLLLSITLVLPLNNAQAARKPGPSITVLAPNGGQTFTEGDVTNITWKTSGTGSDIWIGYSEGTSTLTWIATGLPNTGTYTWTVDVGQTAKTQFKIYISGTVGSTRVSDYSDNYFTVLDGSPTLNFTADSYNLPYNASTTLHWASTRATTCTASGKWSGSKALSGAEGTGALTATSTYTLTCSNKYGSTPKTVTIGVAPAPKPSVNFTADSYSVDYGTSTNLRWDSTNATSCTASGAWSGSKPTSGVESTGPITSTSTYYLTCYGDGGSTQKSVTISVVYQKPTLNFTADSYNLSYGASTTLRWSSTYTTSCTASGKWSGGKPVSGTEGTGPLYSTSTYALSCSGPGGTASSSVTIAVSPSTLPKPTVNFTIDNLALLTSASTTIRWSSTNADYCYASYGWQGTTTTSGKQGTESLLGDKMYAILCVNADKIGEYKEVGTHIFNSLNLYSASGTPTQVLATGKSLNCVSQPISSGKGPASQVRYYFADGNKVRSQIEEARPDGTFYNTYDYIYLPGSVLYTFYGNRAPYSTYYPGDMAYEQYKDNMNTRNISDNTCNEEAVDPLLFVPPTI